MSLIKELKSLDVKSKISTKNIDILYSVLPKLREQHTGDSYEDHSAVKALCDFWNNKVSKEEQAQGFNVYWYDMFEGSFAAGDPEEPNMQINDLKDMADSIFFVNEPHITIAFVFFKGKNHYEVKNNEVSVFLTNGDVLFSQTKIDSHPLDQSYYSHKGLCRLLNKMCETDAKSDDCTQWDFKRLM
jgi:hypothetical protein